MTKKKNNNNQHVRVITENLKKSDENVTCLAIS